MPCLSFFSWLEVSFITTYNTCINYVLYCLQIALIVTDNGANMIKAVRCMKGWVRADDERNNEDSDDNENDDENHETQSNTNSSVINITEEDSNESDHSDEEEEALVEAPFPPDFSSYRLPCFPHTVQLAIGDLQKVQVYKDICTKAKALVSKVCKICYDTVEK